MKRKILAVAMAILALSLVVSCKPTAAPTPVPEATPTPAPPAPKEPIVIAIVGPLSGDVKEFGVGNRDGSILCIEDWNAKGGVLGRPIEYVLGDTKCDSKEASDVGNKVIFEDKVKFICGGVCSSCSIPISEIAGPNKVLQISGPSTNPAVTVNPDGSNKPYIFRTCFLDSYQGYVDAKFTMDKFGAKTAASLYDVGNDYVKGLAEFFKSSFEELGGEVPVFEAYVKEDTDFSALLTKVIEADVDVLFLPDYYPKANLIGKQAKEKGFEGQLMGADGWQEPSLEVTVLDGAYFSSHYSPYDPRPIVGDFLEKYEEEYDVVPDFCGVQAYDAMTAMLLAIEKAGTDDPEVVKDILADLEFDGISGHISFDEHGDPIKTVHIHKVDKTSDIGYVYEVGVAPE
ncbi:MAG: ABC transporter substrate-binding protein [Chloroflexota bacterium]|nr:ABC transporter substrate-binding protein [Chloroflexota bacterium]